MRILYLGLPLGALHLAEHGFAPNIVGLGHPGAPGARRVRRRLGGAGALVLGRPDLEDRGIVDLLRSAAPVVVLSWFWPRRIPPDVLALASRGAFGVHPSLLPRWRGPDPYFWTLRTGDASSGVTLHRLDAAYDTGAIVAQREVEVADDDDAWSLARRLDRPSLALLVLAASRLASGETLRGTPQDERQATHAPRPTPEDLAIDWRAPTAEILRLVRAAAPEPGASADFGGSDVDVLGAERYEPGLPRALEVAEARCVEGGVAVRTADGAVLVSVVRSGVARLSGASLHRFFSD